ncbi:class I SAM-dependent methyltransferase [Pelodictyon luteolum]|uniref:Methyltransferase, putative n=1 Tax=Chlorobium luteolum (strain DSM 273 / BCRC 81028 / 2530) TaxID=319225 RepID=Q3B458_CHLL3|nr:class I SAM-dependent methyltransferase [Pelodictyon luteolum]ABB23873.1 methyltransferase, putative [Pelodictyon luteolum DSM 273]
MQRDPSPSGKAPSGEWFQDWFNHPFYLRIYSHRDRDEAARCVRSILRLTELERAVPSGLDVLDIACGAGRHALELRKLGCRVTANDLSPYLLEQARIEAAHQSLDILFTCRDMRRIDETAAYGLVVQLFTSFGYFDTPEDDRMVLKAVHRALVPGGWYALDLINPLHLERTLVPHSVRRSGDLEVEESRKIEGGRIWKDITITSDSGETVSFTESVQLFRPDTISGMLSEAGLNLQSISGSYNGEPFDPDHSLRLILLSRKD